MTQRDYVTGYNHEVHMPVWAAYTLDKQVTTAQLTQTQLQINIIKKSFYVLLRWYFNGWLY